MTDYRVEFARMVARERARRARYPWIVLGVLLLLLIAANVLEAVL